MRITLVSNWFPPVISGSSFYTSSLAHALVLRGHAVNVVTFDWGPHFAPPANLPYSVHLLPVIRLPKLPLFFSLELMGLTLTPKNRHRLKSIVQQHQTEIIHHINHIFDNAMLSTRVAKSENIPIVGSITTPVQHGRPIMHQLMSLADRSLLGPFAVKRWDGIVSLDQVVHQYVGQLYGSQAQGRSVVIPFGIRFDSLSLYERDNSFPTNERTILFVGHIHPFRNPTKLIEAMPYVLEVVPDAKLVLAGRISIQEPLRKAEQLGLSSERVNFLGKTDHASVINLMKTSQVFASWATGPYPGLGTAPMEAMLCEVPVLNDLPEDLFGIGKLRDGENIILVNSRDPQSIAKAICRLFRDEKLRKSVGQRGREFVLSELSWDRIAGQMEKFYTAVRDGR